MKKTGIIKIGILGMAMSLIFMQCAKDDTITQGDPVRVFPHDTINTYDGTWDLEAHSRLIAEFPYYGESSLFEAEFILWDMEIEFYADHPENSKIEGVVYTRSVQTGAPAGTLVLPGAAWDGSDSVITTSGRDGEVFGTSDYYIKASDAAGITGRKFNKDFYLNGCLTKPTGTSPNYGPSTLGITQDGTKDQFNHFLPSGITNESDKATFKSTSMAAYGDGYVATGNFVWNGITEEVKLHFSYFGTGTEHGYRTIEGEFDFAALEKGFISDVHVQTDVKVKVYAMFSK